jgi:hydrogenase expression/formation protein HypE
VAILSQREGLGFETDILSDCAPLHRDVAALLDGDVDVHCLRDLTRGGLAAALHELAAASGLDFELEAVQVPVHPAVQGACELLGLDPVHVANEGRFLAVVPESQADRAMEILCRFNPEAAVVGRCRRGLMAPVILESAVGRPRILDLPAGEQLPRIC